MSQMGAEIVSAILLLSFFLAGFADSIVCRNEAGESVDWWIVYKIPLLQKDPDQRFRTGLSYAFMTGSQISQHNRNHLSQIPILTYDSVHESWKFSDKNIADQDSIFGQTISPLYQEDRQDKRSFLMYSDQPPETDDEKDKVVIKERSEKRKSSSSLAHAKGILAMDTNTGFWLIHSVPQFPDNVTSRKYSYPSSGKENGQVALCISFETGKELDHIVTQLLCMRANIYKYSMNAKFLETNPGISDLMARRWPKKVAQSTQEIRSMNGVIFTSYARNSKSEKKDLYLEIIAPSIGSDLLVESWRRGSGDPLSSNCSFKFKVNNVRSVELTFNESRGPSHTSAWSYLEDHSKWAIGTEKPATCIGDINRMASQYKRGGGSVCLMDLQVWQVMKDSVHEVEGCPKHKATLSPNTKSHTKRKRSNSAPILPKSDLIILMPSFLSISYLVMSS